MATINGTQANDKLTGTAEADDIYGLFGNEDVSVGDHRKIAGIPGETPFATYIGTDETETIHGTEEADHIEGRGGRDFLFGYGGNDAIFGGDGNDDIWGGFGDDHLEGGEGDDTLRGERGADTLLGQGGNDRLVIESYGDSTFAGKTLDGGAGIDILDFDGLSVSTPLTFSIASPAVAQNLAGATVVNIERISFRGGKGNDDITGGEFDDYIDGHDGDDRIDGGGGNDTLQGGMGIDTIFGGAGNNSIRGSSNDKLYGGEGDDVFEVFDDALVDGGVGTDTLKIQINFGFGATIDLSNPNVETTVLNTRVIGVEQLEFSGSTGNDRVTGGIGNDILIGAYGNDILSGGLGNDVLSGGDGNNQLFGGPGDDDLSVTTSDTNPVNVFDGGEGFDRLHFIATQATVGFTIDLMVNSAMVANIEHIYFRGGFGRNEVSGGALNETLMGGASGDYLNGRGGADDLWGEGGNDTLLGGDGNDYVFGGFDADAISGEAGNDFLSGEDGNDSVDGGAGNDSLEGGLGDDHLLGGDGFDYLAGGLGSDTLTGGAGIDTFLDTAAGLDGDIILDFGFDDRIEITDAELAAFAYRMSGQTLVYTGGSLTLTAPLAGNLVLSAAINGVQLTLTPLDTGRKLTDDFNGDGRSDVLWQREDGLFTDWLGKANGGFVYNDAKAQFQVPTEWKIAGTGDFNGDGRGDVLWRHDDGAFTNWLGKADGSFLFNEAFAGQHVPTNWTVVGTGDFNGDGRSDVMWRNDSSGYVTNWLGQANGGFVYNDANAGADVPSIWKVAGTADFNGDGRTDVVWRRDDGAVTNWLGQEDGGFLANDDNAWRLTPTDWKIAGTGDFDGDGRGDILWRSDTGGFTSWRGQDNGGFVYNDAFARQDVPANWQIVDTGDFNGDFRDDIMWRNQDNGYVTNWLGQANGAFAYNDASAGAFIPLEWNIQPDLFPA